MNYKAFIFSALLISAFISIIEIISRTTSIKRSHSRKITHVGASLLVASLSYIIDYKLFIYLGLFFTIGMSFSRYKLPLKSLSDRAEHSYGEIFLPLGITISAMICTNLNYFVCAVLIVGLADTAAYYFGQNIKSPKLYKNKTIAGSVACLIMVFIISLFVSSVTKSLLIAVILTFGELVSPRGSDNLSLPMLASIAYVTLA